MIRIARPEDGAAFAEIYAPFVADSFVSFEETVPTGDDMASRITNTLLSYPWLAVEEHGKALGYAYASSHRSREGYRWAVDVAVYLADRARGRGLGRTLYETLFPILMAQRYVAAYAGIALPNAASVALHERVGFSPVGVYEGVGFKAGRWTDVGWWQRDLAPRTVPPLEPIPFVELRGGSSWPDERDSGRVRDEIV